MSLELREGMETIFPVRGGSTGWNKGGKNSLF